MHNRNRSMRGEFMSTLKQLIRQRDSVNKQIAAMEQNIAKEKATPIVAEIAKYKSKLQAVGCWPCAVVVDFHFGNTWLHANEAHYNFEECVSYRRISSSQSGMGRLHYSFPDALHYKINGEVDGSIGQWSDFFAGGNYSKPLVQEFLETFIPFTRIETRIAPDKTLARVLFEERLSCCPICGSIKRQKERAAGYSSDNAYGWEYDLQWGRQPEQSVLKNILQRAQAITQNALFDNGIKLERCDNCRRKSFVHKWGVIYKAAKERRKTQQREDCEIVIRNISNIYPHRFGYKAQIEKSIFRQAKKRVRIKPLRRGEIAFFSMNLAATQMKQLKAMKN